MPAARGACMESRHGQRAAAAHRLLRWRGSCVSCRKVVTTSSRSLYAARLLSSRPTSAAMRPTTKEKKKPATIMVAIAHSFSDAVVLLMSPYPTWRSRDGRRTPISARHSHDCRGLL